MTPDHQTGRETDVRYLSRFVREYRGEQITVVHPFDELASLKRCLFDGCVICLPHRAELFGPVIPKGERPPSEASPTRPRQPQLHATLS